MNRILSVLTSNSAPDEAQEKDAIALLQASLDPGALLEADRLDDFESALGCGLQGSRFVEPNACNAGSRRPAGGWQAGRLRDAGFRV